MVGHLGATTVTTVHYTASRNVGAKAAEGMMRDLLRLFEVAPVNRAVLEGALDLGFADFESAVLHEAGRLVGAGALTTRDPAGFLKASLRVYAPDALVAALDVGEGGLKRPERLARRPLIRLRSSGLAYPDSGKATRGKRNCPHGHFCPQRKRSRLHAPGEVHDHGGRRP